jgi:hypothetical protein
MQLLALRHGGDAGVGAVASRATSTTSAVDATLDAVEAEVVPQEVALLSIRTFLAVALSLSCSVRWTLAVFEGI